MTTPQLPVEPWLIVLKNIHTPEDTMQCKLVRKTWNSITEEAVFSNGITFAMSHKTMQQLHQRLIAKPSLCQRINEINLDMAWNADMELVVSIMKKVMDRNVKIITGGGATDSEIYGLLLDIARGSELRLAQVEIVPTPSEFGKLYFDVLQIFKASLKRMSLLFVPGRDQYMEAIWSELQQFKSLEQVTLQNLRFRDLMHLDSYLNKATCNLVRLIVGVSSINEAPDTKEAMDRWCQKSRIHQVHTVKKMDLMPYRSPFGFVILLYVLYKFPKLESLRITEIDCNRHYATIIPAIKHIGSLDLESKFANLPVAFQFIELLVLSDNVISIKYSKRVKQIGLKAQKTSRKSYFEITLPVMIGGPSHLEILASFASSGISSLELDVADLYLSGFLSPPAFFHDVLSSAPQVQSLVVRCFGITYVPEPNFIMPNLKRLTIIDAIMDPLVLTKLTTIAPSLADITLDTCMIGDRNIWPVNMSHSSLDILTIKCDEPATKEDFDINEMRDEFEDEYNGEVDDFETYYKREPGHQQYIRKNSVISGDFAYLGLMVPNKSKFFRLSKEGSGVAISEYVFQENCRGNPTFLFNIDSLKMLRIRLAAFSVTLRFDENHNLLP